VSQTFSTRNRTFLIALAAALLMVVAFAASAGAASPKKPPPPPPTPPPSTTDTFIKNYADVVSGAEADATPEDVQPTADGGTIALASVPSPNGVLVNWLTKLSAVGAIEWQEEVGCLSTPPGAYSIATSLRGTKDGGYVIAGATIGCGSLANCPATSGITCGLVEKLTSTGAVSWAQVYDIGASSTTLIAIRQTADGGYVAVGTETDLNQDTGGLIVKLDPNGAVAWETELGPSTTFQAGFASVVQGADGGYVATGRLTASSRFSLLVAKFSADGTLAWQHAYNNVANGSPSSSVQALSIVGTLDGGYAIAGTWNRTNGVPGTCCSGPVLLELDSQGALTLQRAYVGGVDCFFNGYSETCTSIGGVGYSLQQTKDGGFVLAGTSNIEMQDGAPLEPWLAKVDASGQIVWQENDYRVNPQTGRPLSEYFSALTITNTGVFALGSTENYSNGKGELLGVQTDADGHVALSCTDEHSVALLSGTDPGLVDIGASLTAAAGAGAGQSSAPVQTLATNGTATAPQC
jgi:hypothetical protein